MTADRIDRTGFAPRDEARVRGRHCSILAQLIATVTLALSIAVTATVVTFGIARAEALSAAADDTSGRVAVAILLGLRAGRHGQSHCLLPPRSVEVGSAKRPACARFASYGGL